MPENTIKRVTRSQEDSERDSGPAAFDLLVCFQSSSASAWISNNDSLNECEVKYVCVRVFSHFSAVLAEENQHVFMICTVRSY